MWLVFFSVGEKSSGETVPDVDSVRKDIVRYRGIREAQPAAGFPGLPVESQRVECVWVGIQLCIAVCGVRRDRDCRSDGYVQPAGKGKVLEHLAERSRCRGEAVSKQTGNRSSGGDSLQ